MILYLSFCVTLQNSQQDKGVGYYCMCYNRIFFFASGRETVVIDCK